MTKGYVYVVGNTAYKTLIKIGRTSRGVDARLEDGRWNPITGSRHKNRDPAMTPAAQHRGSLYPHIEILVSDMYKTETLVHRLLKKQGKHHKREWFRCSVEEAIQAIASLGDVISVHPNPSSEHALRAVNRNRELSSIFEAQQRILEAQQREERERKLEREREAARLSAEEMALEMKRHFICENKSRLLNEKLKSDQHYFRAKMVDTFFRIVRLISFYTPILCLIAFTFFLEKDSRDAFGANLFLALGLFLVMLYVTRRSGTKVDNYFRKFESQSEQEAIILWGKKKQIHLQSQSKSISASQRVSSQHLISRSQRTRSPWFHNEDLNRKNSYAVGHSALCSCGSGKKYKICCGSGR